ncbi:MAG: ABC transporter ATP-binding protein [Candidatus Eremiobacteraeota bacterium]|nr:ABC transporter ATP-binding protein [Candidatus Eremiobacteraeota bacterium]
MTDASKSAIALSNVSKRYGAITALDGIDLRIPAGQTIAILGPNGAGKTTAVSLMLGLRRPSAGIVSVLGSDPRDPRTRTALGAMLQTSGIPEHLQVREVIELFRTYYPKPLDTDVLVAACNLGDKLKARVTTLSGGQLQRLYFALAICGDPQIVLLDEPTVGLDVEARRAMSQTIQGIARQGRTIVLTTHYLDEADALADRIVVIDRGHIVADGSPAAIKATVAKKRLAFTCEEPLDMTTFTSFTEGQLRRDGLSYELVTDSPEAILRELFARNVLITDLRVTGASLEEAFLQLTSHEVHHAA